MATEIFDDKEAFLRALQGKPRAKATRAREARPGLPRAGRAAPGEGERLDVLGKLAQRGWTRMEYRQGEFWMTHTSGRESPRCATYREMIDSALEELKS